MDKKKTNRGYDCIDTHSELSLPSLLQRVHHVCLFEREMNASINKKRQFMHHLYLGPNIQAAKIVQGKLCDIPMPITKCKRWLLLQ